MNKQRRSNEGVALILVLGLLTILMISAVAFMISMRVERRGAYNFRQGLQARHMLWLGMVRAMETIDSSMDSGGKVYPSWTALASGGGVGRASLLVREVKNSLPAAQYNALLAASPTWNSIIGGQGWQIGRYSFVALNCSGLLDINRSGKTNGVHVFGIDPGEIQLGDLPDFQNIPNFYATRDQYVRYETFKEFVGVSTGLVNSLPVNMYSYSLCREDERMDTGSAGIGVPKVDITGNYTNLIGKKVDIINGLLGAGVEPLEAENVFSNLLDYVDPDCVPTNLASPCTEAVPMINEISLENRLYAVGTNGATVVTNRALLKVEYCFPFVRPAPASFDFHINARMILSNKTTQAQSISSLARDESDFFAAGGNQRFGVLPQSGTWRLDGTIAGKTGEEINVRFEVTAYVKESAGGKYVDFVPASPTTNDCIYVPARSPAPAWYTVVATSSFPGTVTYVTTNIGVECIDPRFNWRTGSQFWRDYQTNGTTLGTTNYWTTRWWELNLGCDTGMEMHVSDRGYIVSPGELGNLLQGAANGYKFKTLHLFDRDPQYMTHSVFKWFTVAPTNKYYRGRLNVNSTNAEALATIFKGTPVGWATSETDYPTNRLTWAKSLEIAGAIARYSATTQFCDVGDVGALGVDWTTLLPNLSDCERESVISQAAGLLTMRDNLFVIVIGADSFSLRQGSLTAGRVLSSSRAVAELWRDPIRDPVSQKHKWLIRSFRIMGD